MTLRERLVARLVPDDGTIDRSIEWVDAHLPRNPKARIGLLVIIGTVLAMSPWTVPWVFNAGTASFSEYLNFPMLAAQIEQARADVQSVPCDKPASMPTYSVAVAWNQRIAYEHAAKQRWYSMLWSPRGWLNVQPIELPCTGKDRQ